MPTPTPNPYTPDMVPVEIPELDEIKAPEKSSTDTASTFMILGIMVFIAIIVVEAFLLVRTGKLGPQEKPAFAGPSLQK